MSADPLQPMASYDELYGDSEDLQLVVWTCDECGRVVCGDQDDADWGTVWIDWADEHWRVTHYRPCDPSLNCRYWIGVQRIRTVAEVIDWTDHLDGKRWFPATDWSQFLRRTVLSQVERKSAR